MDYKDEIREIHRYLADVDSQRYWSNVSTISSFSKLVLLSFVLQYCGGLISHKCILELHTDTLGLDKAGWSNVVTRYDYNQKLAIDSLIDFFLLYTSVRDKDFLTSLGGLNLNIGKADHAVFGSSFQSLNPHLKARSLRVFESVEIEPSAVEAFTNMTL